MAKQNFYRCGQAAKELGLSSYKVRRLAESGVIPDAEYSGSQWNIPVDAVERMKKEGVPALPKTIDTDNEGGSPTANQKERAPSTLLAAPSPAMVAAAEEAEMSGHELTVAKNKLEQNRVRRDQAEIEDFFSDRAKRLREQEAEEQRRFEEQWEADARQRDKEEAIERRQQFYSEWIEYGLGRKPSAAPVEIEIDIHSEILAALAKVDTNERNSTVRRLVDAAVQRGLQTWKAGENRRGAIEDAIHQLPYEMRWSNSPWKVRATQIAGESLKDVSPRSTKEEMAALARTALQPLVAEFEYAGKVEEAVNNVRIHGSTHDELCEAREAVQEALDSLPHNSTARQITAARDQALAPISAAVAERIVREEAQHRREEVQRQRDRVLSLVAWRLPTGIAANDREDVIAEINKSLNQLPQDASERDMQEVRDEILAEYQREYQQKARRTERKADLIRYGLTQISPYAERMRREFDYDPGETTWGIDLRVRSEVQKALQEELTGRETEQQVGRLVREVMREVEGWD